MLLPEHRSLLDRCEVSRSFLLGLRGRLLLTCRGRSSSDLSPWFGPGQCQWGFPGSPLGLLQVSSRSPSRLKFVPVLR